MKQLLADVYAHLLEDPFAQFVVAFALILVGVVCGLEIAFGLILAFDHETGMYVSGKCE